MNDNKDEVMNYSYIFAKDIFEYNQRKGKMEYFDANLVYNTIYDRHLLLTDNFPHTMIKTIDDALKSKDPRELDKLEAWIDSSLDFDKLTDDELNYLFHKIGFYYNELFPRPRRDIYLYDIDAVNEALVNAIIHNDYRITEPQVSFFDDRLEIISHGGLPFGLSKDQFFNGISKPRNENLTDIFVRLGIVEHTGHGIPTIISKYGKEVFEISDNYIKVVIPFNKEVLENHGALNGALSGVNKSDLTELENKVYEAIKINQNLTAKEISENLMIPFRSVQRYLSTLKGKGFIVREGSNKTGYWKINK